MMIKLFTHEGCVNCKKVKAMLQRILPEIGLDYPSEIIELDIDDPEALTDLMMLDSEQVPTISAGNKVLTGNEILDEKKLRSFVEENTRNPVPKCGAPSGSKRLI